MIANRYIGTSFYGINYIHNTKNYNLQPNGIRLLKLFLQVLETERETKTGRQREKQRERQREIINIGVCCFYFKRACLNQEM